MGVVLFLAGLVAAFVVSNYFYGGRAPEGSVSAASEDLAVTPVAKPEEPPVGPDPAIEGAPRGSSPPPVVATVAAAEGDKAVRLRTAFDSGRLSREAYEANLQKLGLALPVEGPAAETSPIPPAPVSAPIAPPAEDRADRLRRAFESGKLSREAYEANLRKMGLDVPSTPAPVATAATGLDDAAKIERLKQAYAAGRLSRAAYEGNLRKLGGEPVASPPIPTASSTLDDDAKLERLRQAFAAGRIPRAAYEENLRKLGAAPREDPSPAVDLVVHARAARVRDAYQAGRLSRAAYEDNLRKLGIEPEHEEGTTMLPKPKPKPAADTAQDKAARLRAAFEAGKIPRELYERNLRAIGVSQEPEPTPAVAPPIQDERVERLHQAYHAGRISRELYERNVRALGGEPMPEAPAPPLEERPARVTTAFEAAFEESRSAPAPPTPEPVSVPSPAPPPDVRAEKIREAYESGRISRETYERNVTALGMVEAVNPPPPPVEEEAVSEPATVPEGPIANPPPPESEALPEGFEERVSLITRAYAEGRVTRDIYERNLARTYEAVDPRLANLRRALAEGRITQPSYDAGVRRLLQGRGVS